MSWTVYIARCRDGTFYTGVTTDPERRLAQHNSGCGGSYTRSRAPVVLVYWESAANQSRALRRERAIKRLTRAQKERLVGQDAARLARARPAVGSSVGRSRR